MRTHAATVLASEVIAEQAESKEMQKIWTWTAQQVSI